MTDARNPHCLLTTDVIELAFIRIFGENAILKTFEIIDFTNIGDNYLSHVTSIICRGTVNGIERSTQFVAKLNPMRQLQSYAEIASILFEREAIFFRQAEPKLNETLRSLNLASCNFPECFYTRTERDKEIIIMEDLRVRGFKMPERTKTLDCAHVTLTMKALAKLHASSMILKNKSGKELEEIFPALRDDWLEKKETGQEMFRKILNTGLNIAEKLLRNLKGYEDAYKWLNSSRHKFVDMYVRMIKESKPNIKALCHGDCWTNNIMFRYDENGNPLEIALLDLQLFRIASVVMDLHYFFFISLDGKDRMTKLDNHLSVYYEEFRSIMVMAGQKLPFTELELKAEYENNIMYGAISAFLLMPLAWAQGSEIINMDEMNDEVYDEAMEEKRQKYLERMEKNPAFKSLFLSIFDELTQKGLIPSSQTSKTN